MHEEPLGVNGLSIDKLIEQCQQQTDMFLRFQPTDNSSCFEVCRFAFYERNSEAWEAFYTIYTPLVQQWLKRLALNQPVVTFDYDEVVQGTFTRIFRAIPPEKFPRFSSLPGLLEYLKLCCRAEVMNTLREYYKNRRFQFISVPEKETEDSSDPYKQRGENLTGVSEVDTTGGEQVDRERLWKLICKILNRNQERLAILCQYFEGMAPREILQEYPKLFKDMEEVRYALRNAKYKLKNSEELKDWLKDFNE